MVNSPNQKRTSEQVKFDFSNLIYRVTRIECLTRKRKSRRIFLLGLHTILAVIKWILGSRTIFHFTVSSPGAE